MYYHCCFSAASFRLRWEASIWRRRAGRAGGRLGCCRLSCYCQNPWIERCARECRHFRAPVNAQTGPWYVRSCRTRHHCWSSLCPCWFSLYLRLSLFFLLFHHHRISLSEILISSIGLNRTTLAGPSFSFTHLALLYSNCIDIGCRFATETKQRLARSSSQHLCIATLSQWLWLWRLER